MKLGLVIKITNEGVPGETFSVNKEDLWARYTEDVRTPIKELVNFDGTEKVAYLVKFLGKEGYLICVIKARPEGSGRANDNTAAWIHFPSFINISSSTICNILKDVEVAISGEKGIDKEELKTLFAQDYGTKDVLFSAVATITSKHDSAYAIRYYNGDYTLNELLGPSVAQQEYGKYKGLLLVDKQRNITHSSQYELCFEPKKICQYAPPGSIDGFDPCILIRDKYQSFNKAIEVPEDGKVSLLWVKKGYAVIKKSFEAKDGPTCPHSAIISPNEYKIIVKRDHFHIYGPNSVLVKNPEISIDGRIMSGDSMEVSESSYNDGVCLVVRAKGFVEYRKEKEKLTKSMMIYMELKCYHYEFEIPLRDGEEDMGYIPLSIDTHHKLQHCPIEGYETGENGLREMYTNRLYKRSDLKTKVKYFLYGVASVFIAALLIIMYNTLDDYELQFGWPPVKPIEANKTPSSTDYNTGENQQDNPTPEVQEQTDSIAAIRYLDNNEVWVKDSLDNYEVTLGLFEELNEFNLSQVVTRFNEKLCNSERLRLVKTALENNISQGFNPSNGKEKTGGKYNPENDKRISVSNYINWLSKDHSVSTPPQANSSNMSKITGRKEGSSNKQTSVDQGDSKTSTSKQTNRRGGI